MAPEHLTEMELGFKSLEDEVWKNVQNACDPLFTPDMEIVTPSGVVLSNTFKNHAHRILDLEVKDDDVWVISFPKCGTTWTLEMVWLLMNNIDFEKANSTILQERAPFLELRAMMKEVIPTPDTLNAVETMKSPRVIKSHLPLELLPRQIWTKNPKIIYVSRNPNDAAISFFHHHRLWFNYSGSQEMFLRAFVEDKLLYCPFWDQVLSFWKLRHRTNVLFIQFEDMKKDLANVMKTVADFLKVSYTKSQEDALLDHLSFEKMKTNASVNFEEDIKRLKRTEKVPFMRQGEVGSWKKVLSPEFSKIFEEWTNKNLEGTDYPRL